MKNWLRKVNPMHTWFAFLLIWGALTMLGARYTNWHIMLVVGVALILGLQVNKWVADLVLSRNMKPK